MLGPAKRPPLEYGAGVGVGAPLLKPTASAYLAGAGLWKDCAAETGAVAVGGAYGVTCKGAEGLGTKL